MIQRIQTLFLIGVVVCMLGTLLVPIWSKSDLEINKMMELTAFSLNTYEGGQQTESKTTIYLAILAIAAAASAAYSISQYKKRFVQIKLGALSSFLMAAFLLSGLYVTSQAEKIIDPGSQGEYVVGYYLTAAALVCNLLANRFIRRDERLVKSVDRLR